MPKSPEWPWREGSESLARWDERLAISTRRGVPPHWPPGRMLTDDTLPPQPLPPPPRHVSVESECWMSPDPGSIQI